MTDKKLQIGIAPSRSYRGDWWSMLQDCLHGGFAGVEFKYELPFIVPGKVTDDLVRKIAHIGREEELFFSIHAPYVNIGAILPYRFQEALDEHRRALDCATEIGARTYTVHSGWVEAKYATDELISICHDRTAEATQMMIEHNSEIAICLENQNSADKNKVKCATSVEQLHSLASEVDGPVYFTFDIGHANVFAGKPIEFLRALGPYRVRMCHVHDNNGLEDEHHALETGNIDWRAFVEAYSTGDYPFPLFFELSRNGEFVAGKKLVEGIWDEIGKRATV